MMGLKYHKKYVFITRLMTNPIFKGYFSQAFCKVLCSQKRPWQSQVPSANLRYLFVKNKFGCSKPQFFPWSFINSFLNMSYILY